MTRHRTTHAFFTKSFCTSIIKDEENGYWVSTHSDGVYYLPNLSFHAVSAYPELATKDVKCIRPLSKYTVGAGFADGNILLINNTNLSNKIFPEWVSENKNKRILDIQSFDANNILISGDCGIHKLSNGKTSKVIDPPMAIKGVFIRSDTTLIASFSSGIMSIKQDGSKKNIFTGRTTCVTGQGEKYYWGTQHGVYVVSNDSIIHLGKKYPQLSGVINHLDIAPDSALWASTQEGIAVLKNNKITSFRREHGILSNICKHVSFDGHTAWISTNKGISRIDYRWSGAQLHYSISNITEEDGLTANDVNQTTPGGKYLWAATARGISFFSKDYISRSEGSPLINITGIIAGKETLPMADTITLEYPNNKLRIELSGISYKSGKQIHYEYRLKELDRHWSSLINNVVEFSALPFGQFVFEVRAVDRWGEKSDHPKRIMIINKAPFWKSTAFMMCTYLAMALLLAIVFYTFHRRQQRKKEQEYQLKKKMHSLEMKALQAQMNPHFIFNCLTSIQYHIMRADVRSANIYLHKFSTLIRQNLQHSTSSSILLQEEIKILTLYLELEKLRLAERMDYDINLSGGLKPEDLYIPSMIVQPYVENAIKHGVSPLKDRKGIILVTFRQSGDYIDCFIEDNGPGIHRAEKKGATLSNNDHVSMGTTITANRISTLNVIRQRKILLKITDKLETGYQTSGTIVHLSFPILTD